MHKLHLRVCAFYRREVAAAIKSLGYDDVEVEAYVAACGQPGGPREDAGALFAPAPRDGVEELVVGACSLAPTPPLAPHGRLIRLTHCLEMLLGPGQLEAAISSGAYVLSPGWLRHWPERLRRWGFDQATARQFFHEFSRELLLLDTGVDPRAPAELARLAAFLDLPYRVSFVGLDYLKLYLAKLVLEWRLQSRSAQVKQVLQEANRKIADYAMAFELLVNLSHITAEEETLAAIRDLFAMLFGSAGLEYAQVEDGRVRRVFSTGPGGEGAEALERVLAGMEGSYALIEGPGGFYLRIAYQGQTLGLVAVRAIAFPEYRDRYLNLGLTIAELCGLTIANARTYQLLQEAEQQLRHERDLEQLRQTMARLTSEPDLEIALGHVLRYVAKLVPCQVGLLLLLEECELRVVSAVGGANPGALIGQKFAADQPLFARVIEGGEPQILARGSCELCAPQPPGYAELGSWLAAPLQDAGKVVGVLAVGGARPDLFTPAHAVLAQALANEAQIALENARLFQKMRLMADTDPLTRVHNRRRFTELAELEFKRATRYGTPLSVIFVDIDHFKRVNDSFGHAAGDQVLEQVATRLRHVRSSDLVARYGGEEFVVCSATGPPEAGALGERLRQVVGEQPIETMGGLVAITISVGVATVDPAVASLAELIQRADHALYLAKAGGRNRVCVWGEG
jgi:diguanylate cyclase (GGDEF)-like protein